MGAYVSLEQNAVVVQAVGSTIGGTGTYTGRAIDTAGYSEALVILAIGGSAATGALTVKMQHADADTGYADLTGAAFTAKTNADNKVYTARLKLDGNTVKRWIKFIGTTATDVVDFTVTVILMGHQYKPEDLVADGYAAVPEWTK